MTPKTDLFATLFEELGDDIGCSSDGGCLQCRADNWGEHFDPLVGTRVRSVEEDEAIEKRTTCRLPNVDAFMFRLLRG